MATRPYAKEFYNNLPRGDACPVCGLSYVMDSPDDQRTHRAYHREVVETFEPRPVPTLAELHAEYGTFIPVRAWSPIWLRKRLYRIGLMFKRELGFDFQPCDLSYDPGYGYILTDADGRAIGGCMARWKIYEDAPPNWVLAWIWIVPSHRRNGLMKQAWETVKSEYEGIEPDPPFSRAAAKFFRYRVDVSERIRARAEFDLSDSPMAGH